MRPKFFWIVAILLFFVSLQASADFVLDEDDWGEISKTYHVDSILGRYGNSLPSWDYSALSIDVLDSIEQIYLSYKMLDRVALCQLLKGAKYYSMGDNKNAITCLKSIEQNFPSDSFDYGYLLYYLSRVLAVDNPQQSKYYAQRLHVWSNDNEHAYLLAMSNKLLMNLTDDIDSASHYRLEAIDYFSIFSDSLMIDKTNARFAIKFIEQLPIDSIEALIRPFYGRVGYARDADALATVYLINERADEAYPYIQKLAGVKGFEFQYYNNMAVYYSQKKDFEKALLSYDTSFHIYQQQAETILNEQIARVNGEYDKKLYDQQIQLQHYRNMLLSLIFVLVAIVAISLIIWLVRIVYRNRLKNRELKQEKAKLEEKNEVLEVQNEELVDTTKKQTQKLYAVSDICKNTYASIVLANPDMVKVISRSLYENLKETYPQLSNMDFTYMFLDFIGLGAKDICRILSVQEGTYYCRRSAIKKKLGTELNQDIDEIFNQFFLGQTLIN
ncbi:MAG: cell division protein ZapB [Paludibacteraceae bacterium]|nr:cell division protein ZapB [Paludibacteraceae bacterium]